MSKTRHPKYPPGLDEVAERFGVSSDKLIELIASGELEVVRPDDDELTEAELLEEFRQSWQEAMTGQTIPAREALASIRKGEKRDDH